MDFSYCFIFIYIYFLCMKSHFCIVILLYHIVAVLHHCERTSTWHFELLHLFKQLVRSMHLEVLQM